MAAINSRGVVVALARAAGGWQIAMATIEYLVFIEAAFKVSDAHRFVRRILLHGFREIDDPMVTARRRLPGRR